MADGEVKLEGQEVNLNENRGVTIYEGKAVPDLEKLLDTEEGALLPEVTVTAAGKVELTTEEGENTVQNRGEKVTYYLAWEHADLSHPSNRYRDEPEQKDYDWAQWRLNIAAGMVVVGSVTILGAVVAGAAAGAGMIAAGNISAGSAASSVGGAVFLTGSLYVAEQAVSDAVSGRLGDTEKYVRKALAGSVVGFLTGASGLMMQGASLGKVLSLGFGEGFLGSTAEQGLLNEDGEINWALAIGDGMFSAVMAGLVWKGGNVETVKRESPARRIDSRVSVTQKDIDNVLENELAGVKFSSHPTYNGRIKDYGRTDYSIDRLGRVNIKNILIGKQRNKSVKELMDTLLHEELEARIALRSHDILHPNKFYEYLDQAGDKKRHEYINKIITRFFKGKGIE